MDTKAVDLLKTLKSGEDNLLKRKIYDAIIVGGGHNGLVCAAYLAQNGLSVLVLERRPVIGGACVTEEIADCKVSRAAYVYSLFPQKIVKDLGLSFELLERDPPSFTPLLDGRSLVMWQNTKLTCGEISRFSQHDADVYPEYEATLDRLVKFIEPMLFMTPPDPGKKRDWPKLLKIGYQALKLKGDLKVLNQLFTLSAYDFVRQYFESEPLIATLCTDGIIGTVGGPMAPGTAYVLLHHVMGEVNGHRGRWGYVCGGMGQLSESILRTILYNDGHYMTKAEVAQILTVNNRAIGVALKDGRVALSKIVVSGVDPDVTFNHLIGFDNLPDDFAASIARIDYQSATAKVNLIVNGELKFKHFNGPVPGTFHICEDSRYIEKAADDAKHGRISENLVLEGCIPTITDPDLAPKGRQIISLLVQYVPYQLAEGIWEIHRPALLDKTISKLAEYTNIRDLEILASDVLTPVDLEREFNLTGGNLFHGAMNLSQLFSFRPVLGWANYRTPVDGLYLCGSATHPGGGVTGIPGHNAAREILRDKKWLKC